MSTVAGASARPLLLDIPARARRALPEGSLRAALAGLEAAAFGWLSVVVPAVASYVATAAAPALGEATWLQAAAAGTGLWLLAHGGTAMVSGAEVTVVPLGLSLLAVGLVAFCVGRARVATGAGLAAVAVGYGGAVGVLGAIGGHGPSLPALLGAVVVATLGSLPTLRRERRRADLTPLAGARARAVLDRVPPSVRAAVGAGVRGAVLGAILVLAVGVALVVASLAAHGGRIAAVAEGLRVDGFDGFMLVLASAVLLPNLALWAVAWLAGPGFAVGQGTLVAPGEATLGPLPAFPVLAGLPAETTAGALAAWTPVVLVVVGAVVGWSVHRGSRVMTFSAASLAVVVAALGTALLVGALAAAAGGAVGPGRMAVVGSEPGAVAAALAWQLGTGALAVVVAGRLETTAVLRRGAERARRAVPLGRR